MKIVKVRTIDGNIYQHNYIKWYFNTARDLVINTGEDQFTYYAVGQWVYASDIADVENA